MPEQLKESEIKKGQDPSVSKQWDNEVPLDKKFEDFAAIADKLGVCVMGTMRDSIGVCNSGSGILIDFMNTSLKKTFRLT